MSQSMNTALLHKNTLNTLILALLYDYHSVFSSISLHRNFLVIVVIELDGSSFVSLAPEIYMSSASEVYF